MANGNGKVYCGGCNILIGSAEKKGKVEYGDQSVVTHNNSDCQAKALESLKKIATTIATAKTI